MKRLDLENNKIFIEWEEKGRYLAFSLLQDTVKIYKDNWVIEIPYTRYDIFAHGTQRTSWGKIITNYSTKRNKRNQIKNWKIYTYDKADVYKKYEKTQSTLSWVLG